MRASRTVVSRQTRSTMNADLQSLIDSTILSQGHDETYGNYGSVLISVCMYGVRPPVGNHWRALPRDETNHYLMHVEPAGGI